MTDTTNSALLPAGLPDLLPPMAAAEAWLIEGLIARFQARGYERVKPPLVEYETTLLAGPGAGMDRQTFRLMDPHSQRMLGLRADITPQISRVARTRLANAPRPLRLCYAGQVMRVSGSQPRPERQFGQVGAELLGSDTVEADAEVLLMAAEALRAMGLTGLSIDLCLPRLVPAMMEAADIRGDAARTLRAAVDSKDDGALVDHEGGQAGPFAELVRIIGPVESALPALAAVRLAGTAALERDRLVAVVEHARRAMPDLVLTVDPVEHKGFEYQTGLCFTIFGRGIRGELGRGGRYHVVAPDGAGSMEPATGFTLYTDSVGRAVPRPEAPRRVFVPHGAAVEGAARLRAEGWVTVAGLVPVTDEVAEARRLLCAYRLTGETTDPVPV